MDQLDILEDILEDIPDLLEDILDLRMGLVRELDLFILVLYIAVIA